MAGNLIPKSMSLDEARAYVADAANWQTEPEDDLELSPGEEVLYDAEQPESEPADTEYLHAETPTEDGAGRLREDAELEADIELVCGPAALAKPAEARHYATLRLIDDLITARTLLDDMTGMLQTITGRAR